MQDGRREACHFLRSPPISSCLFPSLCCCDPCRHLFSIRNTHLSQDQTLAGSQARQRDRLMGWACFLSSLWWWYDHMDWVASLVCKCYESCFSQCVCLLWLLLLGRARSLLRGPSLYLDRLSQLLLAALVPCSSIFLLLLFFIHNRLLLLFIVVILLDVLLFGGACHLAHAHIVFGLFVDRFHVVSRRQHLVLAQLARVLRCHPLLSFPFALFGTSPFVKSSV